MKLTRRQLAAAVAPAIAHAQAQSRPPATPDDELKTAQDRIRANGETLARQAVPMATEPAFQFKA
jgi:hypothetical protein